MRQQPLRCFTLSTSILFTTTFLLSRRLAVVYIAAAATIPSPIAHSRSICCSTTEASLRSDADGSWTNDNDHRLETVSTTTWWDDDNDSDLHNLSSDNQRRTKQTHKSLLSLWWQSLQRWQHSTTSSHQLIYNRLPVSTELPQQQQHPLRTDLYEIYCRWRGIAKPQSQKQQRNRTRRKGQHNRALWTSRLASMDVENDEILLSSLSREVSSLELLFNKHSNGDDQDCVKSMYDYNTFRLEFDPSGYVRFLLHPIYSDDESHQTDRNNFNNNRSVIDNSFDVTDIHSCIGTWKLQPNGLVIQFPLPTLNQNKRKQGQEEQQRHLIMEMDFHMNPFGVQPKFTRGLIFISTNNSIGNPLMKLLNLRPIVGTFTGKGIGIDTMDLSYHQRN